jgi:hypothetical protein
VYTHIKSWILVWGNVLCYRICEPCIWVLMQSESHTRIQEHQLTPKGPRPFFGPFLKFGQAIVDAVFVQKISNFWWTCVLVLASRRTNFYRIPIYSLGAMFQKQNYFEVRAARAAEKLFILKLFWVEFFSHKFFTKFLIIPSTWKSSKTHGIY